MADRYVLGCGLSGLIFAFYNRDFVVISPDIGGKLKHDFMSSTILLHDAPETQDLLRDLGFRLEPEAHIVRYYQQGRFLDSPSTGVYELVARKKLTKWDKLPVLNTEVFPALDRPPTTEPYLPVFKVSSSDLVKALGKNIHWMQDSVLRITDKELVTEKRKRLPYAELVSSITAPLFWKLFGQAQRAEAFQYLPATFINSEISPFGNNNEDTWDLVYFVDLEIPYTRVNRNPRTGEYLYEFSGLITEAQLANVCPNIVVKDRLETPVGIIVTDLNNIPPPGVRFVGRFATWDHRLRIPDVIRESKALYDFRSVWNYQKAFNANFFDYNVVDLELQQRLTKDFVLLLTDEAHELLSSINWKMLRYLDNPVDRQQVLEEWVDIFKYWLGIGSIWGFTLDDFFREFWRKSREVETRYSPDILDRIRGLMYGKGD